MLLKPQVQEKWPLLLKQLTSSTFLVDVLTSSTFDACMTRLRVTVKEADKVGTEEQWKAEGAMGLVMKGQGVQAIYGPKADVLKSDIQDVLDSG